MVLVKVYGVSINKFREKWDNGLFLFNVITHSLHVWINSSLNVQVHKPKRRKTSKKVHAAEWAKTRGWWVGGPWFLKNHWISPTLDQIYARVVVVALARERFGTGNGTVFMNPSSFHLNILILTEFNIFNQMSFLCKNLLKCKFLQKLWFSYENINSDKLTALTL